MTRVIVLSGGVSPEHEVSLASGADVAGALQERHNVVSVVIDSGGTWRVEGHVADSPDDVLDEIDSTDVVFPVLHGGWGENGGLQSVLDERGIRYVGSRTAACRTGMSKLATARAAASRGISPIPVRVLHRDRYLADPDLLTSALARSADLPLVVKPDTGGSSVGVSVVHSGLQLRAALDEAFLLDPVVLLQPLVRGQEISIGVWSDNDGTMRATGGSLLHLPEGEAAFTYAHKYQDAGGWLEIPMRLPAEQLADLQQVALQTAAAVGVDGLARVDVFVSEEGILLNEINTMPGLRRNSHFPRLVAASGPSYPELLDSLVQQVARTTRAAAPSL